MKPQPDTYPISEGIVGLSKGSAIRATTELYFPEVFDNLACEVLDFNIEYRNLRQMTLKIYFRVSGKENELKDLYKEEAWKVRATENFLKHNNTETKFDFPVPIFALMLNKYLRVNYTKLHRNKKSVSVLFDQTPDLLLLPNSFPPVSKIPKGHDYNYYEKKATVFYADLKLGEFYNLEIEIESMGGSFELAPFFPYKTLFLKNLSFNSTSDLQVSLNFCKVEPMRSSLLPDWLEYRLEKKLNPKPMPSNIKAALPFRGEDVLFGLNGTYGLPRITSPREVPNNLLLELNDVQGINLYNYKTLRFVFMCVIPPDKKIEVIVKTIKGAIPTRIYEKIQNLPAYDNVIVEYDIINLDKEKLRLRAETEILGYTNKERKIIFIAGINNKTNKKARAVIRQCPKLKRGVLEQIVNSEHADMVCKITNEDTKDVIYEEMFDVELLPHDQMVWKIKDVDNSNDHNLAPFIGHWIYPNDKNGLLDKARSAAANFHLDKAFGHRIETLEDVEKHAKAIYDYLSTNGVKYVSQPFTTKTVWASQRVVPPERVLANKSGNCIDLVVLFSSLLESVGIYSLIFLTPSHAFIGWGDPISVETMTFLETTLIGRKTFEEAQEAAKNTFKKEFLFVGSDNLLPNDLIYWTRGCQVVNLKEVRQNGIYSRIM